MPCGETTYSILSLVPSYITNVISVEIIDRAVWWQMSSSIPIAVVLNVSVTLNIGRPLVDPEEKKIPIRILA